MTASTFQLIVIDYFVIERKSDSESKRLVQQTIVRTCYLFTVSVLRFDQSENKSNYTVSNLIFDELFRPKSGGAYFPYGDRN